MKLQPATRADADNIALAIAMLKQARTLLVKARAPKSAARVRAALSSALGAERHVSTRVFRTEHPRA